MPRVEPCRIAASGACGSPNEQARHIAGLHAGDASYPQREMRLLRLSNGNASTISANERGSGTVTGGSAAIATAHRFQRLSDMSTWWLMN